MNETRDTHVDRFESIEPPTSLQAELPMSQAATETVLGGRKAIRRALAGNDERLLVVVGPCSIHDPIAARDYAGRLAKLRPQVEETLLLVMRVYFEKPRTTIGWKGFINDPHLDGSYDVNHGLREARRLLLDINDMGLPCATEFLDPIVPQFTSGLVTWAAIGARTTESQTHREMASGLSMPVGFKNATDGDLQIAIDGMTAARHPHAFLGITTEGRSAVVRTTGNDDVHLVLRGGKRPNFGKPHIAYAKAALESFPLRRPILVDCSHGNSGKSYQRQPEPFRYLVELSRSEPAILGMMLESNIVAGTQPLGPSLRYGQSVTDACMDWQQTEELLLGAHDVLRAGR